jgi:hypothetical protein
VRYAITSRTIARAPPPVDLAANVPPDNAPDNDSFDNPAGTPLSSTATSSVARKGRERTRNGSDF